MEGVSEMYLLETVKLLLQTRQIDITGELGSWMMDESKGRYYAVDPKSPRMSICRVCRV